MKMPFKRLPSGVGGGSWVYFFADGTSVSDLNAKIDEIDKYDKHLRELNASQSRPWPADPVAELEREIERMKVRIDDLEAITKAMASMIDFRKPRSTTSPHANTAADAAT